MCGRFFCIFKWVSVVIGVGTEHLQWTSGSLKTGSL